MAEQEEFEELEREAESFLAKLDADDGDGDGNAALVKRLRAAAGGRKRAETAAYERGKADALEQLRSAAQRQTLLERFNAPADRDLAGTLFPVELGGDAEAWTKRAEELLDRGVSWGWTPPEQVEQAQQAQQAQVTQEQDARGAELAAQVAQFTSAQTLASAPGGQADLLTRTARDPSSLKPHELAEFEHQFNANMAALNSRPGAGIQT
jgi:hypothetical protein